MPRPASSRFRAFLPLICLGGTACDGLLGVDFNDAHSYAEAGADGGVSPSDEGGADDSGGGFPDDSSGMPPSLPCPGVCPTNTYCDHGTGTCVGGCPPTQSVCGTSCVSLSDDPSHCGSCDTMCSSGASCAGGACGGQVLATGLYAPNGLVLDDTYVYFGNAGIPKEPTTGALLRVPKAGGPALVLAGAETSPGPLAIDATNLYWAHDTVLTQMPLAGGPRTTVAPFDGLVFAIGGGTAFLVQVATILSVPLGGSGTPMNFAMDNNQIGSIAADAANVYWCDQFSGTVEQMSGTGGSMLTIASNQMYPSSIAVDASYVYWTTSPFVLNKVPIGGGTVTNFGSEGGGGPLAFDATNIYVASGLGIQKTPKAGGTTVTLAANAAATAIAVDDAYVYWVTTGTETGPMWNADARLVRMPK